MLTWYLWGHEKVAWGYEVRIDAWNEETGQHYPFCMTWWREAGVPDAKTIVAEAQRRVELFEAKLAEPPEVPKPIYTEEEVVSLLVEKGYLQDGQALSDLPQKGAA